MKGKQKFILVGLTVGLLTLVITGSFIHVVYTIVGRDKLAKSQKFTLYRQKKQKRKLPKVSLQLLRYLHPQMTKKAPSIFFLGSSKLEKEAVKAFNKGRPYTNPQKLQKALVETGQSLRKFEKLIQLPGCYPTKTNKILKKHTALKHSRFQKGVHALIYRAYLRTQQGNPNRSAETLLRLHKRILFYEQDCYPGDSIFFMGMLIEKIHWGFIYLSRHPKLSLYKHKAFLEQVEAWETRSQSTLAHAIIKKNLERLVSIQKRAQKHRFRPFGAWVKFPGWLDVEGLHFSKKQTSQMLSRLVSCVLTLVHASYPLNSWKTCKAIKELEKSAYSDSPIPIPKYNLLGKFWLKDQLHSDMFGILLWHSIRCHTSVQRMLLLYEYPKMHHKFLPENLRKIPNDFYTGNPLTLQKARDNSYPKCKPSKKFLKYYLYRYSPRMLPSLTNPQRVKTKPNRP